MVNAPHSTTNPDETPASIIVHGRVIAAVYSPGTLAAARELPPSPVAPDWLELRVDGFASGKSEGLVALETLAAKAPRPLVVTVRHPAEGGADSALADAQSRRRLYERFMASEAVTAVDLEVRSLRALAEVVQNARGANHTVIASYHDFHGVPPPARMRELARRAAEAGATVFKLAATVETPGDLARLLDFIEWGRGQNHTLAVMGMGRLGRVSRLALAVAGSVLNYGYLDGAGPQVPGQWPVTTLRERIAECL